MKLLAIHSNELFLKPESPNVYKFLAEKRDKLDEFENISKEYEAKKEQGPIMLETMLELVAKGLTVEEFNNNCNEYWQQFKSNEIEKNLKTVREKFDLIYIFTSYPKAIFVGLIKGNLADNVFGVDFKEENGVIEGMAEVQLSNVEEVKSELGKIGMQDNFTLEPNRYGLLEVLIDQMIANKIEKADVVVMGKKLTAQPMYQVSGKQVENFSELYT